MQTKERQQKDHDCQQRQKKRCLVELVARLRQRKFRATKQTPVQTKERQQKDCNF